MADKPETKELKPFHGLPGPGRPKGSTNKKTDEVRQLCQRLVNDKKYQESLFRRMLSGDIAPQIEGMIWLYAYGKPEILVPPTEVKPLDSAEQQQDSYNDVVELYKRAIATGVLPQQALASIPPPSENGHGPQ